jgi:hypothetical protein
MVISCLRVLRRRAADDFATIRARLEELRRERECAQVIADGAARDPLPALPDRIGLVVIRIPG